MKVVHITSSIGGGAGIAAYRIHESLMEDSRVDSSLLQMNPIGVSLSNMKVYRQTHFHSLSYRIQKKFGLLPYISKNEHYQKIISTQPHNYEIVSLPFSYYPLHLNPIIREADIIHLHWISNFIDYPSFFKNIKQPIVWTLHDMNPFSGIFHYEGDQNKNKNPHLKKIDCEIRQIKAKCIRSHNNIHIVSPSKWMMDRSIASDIFSLFPHQVIPNGLNINSSITEDKALYKKALGIDFHKKTFLFIADHIHNQRKGLDLIIQALKTISSETYNIISVGAGDVLNLFSPEIKHYNFGSISNPNILNLIYSAADATILPSREDNLPNVILESMLNGTPVIGFSNGGMKEHIYTGINGILIEEITALALSKALDDFIQYKYTFNSDTIKGYAIKNFNYTKLSNSYYSLYESILAK